MKWLIIQSDGAHKGQAGWTPNWYLRECYAIQHALNQCGHTADIWGLSHSNFTATPDFEEYDVLFCLENYEAQWLPQFESIRGPLKIQWIMDLHCQHPSVYLPITQGCDVVLHSTRRLIPAYRAEASKQKHLWFPNGVDDRFFDAALYGPAKKHGLRFIGSDLQQRRETIKLLKANAGLEYRVATGEDMLQLVSTARVHFNKNIGGDINYRTFETIGLGTCLLTNADDDLELLGFKDGINCLTYRNDAEALEKARWAMSDEAAADVLRIAAAGYTLSKLHSYTERIRPLLAYLNLRSDSYGRRHQMESDSFVA